MSLAPLLIQVIALMFLGMAALGKDGVFGDRILTFEGGMFLWLLSLMVSIALHAAA
jgi:hypothetical protein